MTGLEGIAGVGQEAAISQWPSIVPCQVMAKSVHVTASGGIRRSDACLRRGDILRRGNWLRETASSDNSRSCLRDIPQTKQQGAKSKELFTR
jgi:hypothetical protein